MRTTIPTASTHAKLQFHLSNTPAVRRARLNGAPARPEGPFAIRSRETLLRAAHGFEEAFASFGAPKALTAAFDTWLQGTAATTIKNGVATIPVTGFLTAQWSAWNFYTSSSACDQLAYDIARVVADGGVSAIILAVDSEGGTVNCISALASAIETLGAIKPIDVHVDGAALSGAYWLASAARSISVARTAMLGSIGAVWSFTDWSGYEAKLGIRTTDIVSTQSPKKIPDPATKEGRATLQPHINAIAQVFIDEVLARRPQVQVTALGGDLRVGENAIAMGLADRVEGFEAMRTRLQQESDAAKQDPSAAMHAALSKSRALSRAERTAAEMDAARAIALQHRQLMRRSRTP